MTLSKWKLCIQDILISTARLVLKDHTLFFSMLFLEGLITRTTARNLESENTRETILVLFQSHPSSMPHSASLLLLCFYFKCHLTHYIFDIN